MKTFRTLCALTIVVVGVRSVLDTDPACASKAAITPPVEAARSPSIVSWLETALLEDTLEHFPAVERDLREAVVLSARAGDVREGLEHLEDLVGLNPCAAEYYVSRALCWDALGHGDEAKRQLRRASEAGASAALLRCLSEKRARGYPGVPCETIPFP